MTEEEFEEETGLTLEIIDHEETPEIRILKDDQLIDCFYYDKELQTLEEAIDQIFGELLPY
jgi:hypothetical protein